MFRLFRELKQLREFKSKTKPAFAMKVKSRLTEESSMIAVGPVQEFSPVTGTIAPECKGYLLLTPEEFERAQKRMIKFLG
jgi:hypothetical protein